MGRPSKVRYREDRGAWVTVIEGKYRTLARGRRNRAEAMKAFHRLKAAQANGRLGLLTPDVVTVGALIDGLLVWIRSNREECTLAWYKSHLDSFGRYMMPETPCGAMKAIDGINWLETRELGQSSRHGAITALRRLGNWGVKRGHLLTNPFTNLEKPPMLRRENILSPADEVRVIEAANPWLRPYLEFLRETGCRPSEGAKLQAKHCNLEVGTATMPSKTMRKTGRLRVIYLTARAIEIIRPLIEKRPVGPLFRNQRDNGWHHHALASAMGRLRRKLGLGPGCTCESFRHGWVTEAKMTLPNSVVAELAGHTSTQMIDRFYSHVNERASELLAAVARVRRPGTATSSPPDAAPSPPPPAGALHARPGTNEGTDHNPPR